VPGRLLCGWCVRSSLCAQTPRPRGQGPKRLCAALRDGKRIGKHGFGALDSLWFCGWGACSSAKLVCVFVRRPKSERGTLRTWSSVCRTIFGARTHSCTLYGLRAVAVCGVAVFNTAVHASTWPEGCENVSAHTLSRRFRMQHLAVCTWSRLRTWQSERGHTHSAGGEAENRGSQNRTTRTPYLDARFPRVPGVCLNANYTMRVAPTEAVNDNVHT
jgi:hypothetical protein